MESLRSQYKSGGLSPIDIWVGRHFRGVRPFVEGVLIPFGVGIVGAMQFTAFYLMLHASLLFLHYNGPFIFGTVLYITIGVLTFLMWFFRLFVNSGVGLGERLVSKLVEETKKMENTVRKMEHTESMMEQTESKMEDTENRMEHTESKMEQTELKMEELAKEIMKLAKELVEAGVMIKKPAKERDGLAG
jgi:hypothetical protein